MIGHHQLPRRDREMTSHREIKPETGRRSFAPFAPADRQHSAFPYNNSYNQCLRSTPFNRQSRSPFESKPRTYIKRSEVGQFNPTYPDPDDLEMVSDGKTLVFTGVMVFQERLHSFTDDANPEAENQILGLLDTLFSGSALIWWNSELTAQDRRELRYRGGLPVLLDALRQRFRQDPAIASAKYTQGRLSLSDLADDAGNLQNPQNTEISPHTPYFALASGTSFRARGHLASSPQLPRLVLLHRASVDERTGAFEIEQKAPTKHACCGFRLWRSPMIHITFLSSCNNGSPCVDMVALNEGANLSNHFVSQILVQPVPPATPVLRPWTRSLEVGLVD
ncbi:hypothetical protein CONLIGDRAFT_701331 [Coniochaeta ligniaria NRRL 30616]|uniref:Uncharacterized protein n=1 Tax=Coniochaeta ligniaria NRRL 30616 TaxID=1408157 RepID=A0A1J7I3J0_9PEZI|nr:hypothetical protein CONLIGDRAFT_701331 [Coniochaeta ligniaria NRRL 30616]